jgi:hypothetical protein
MFHLVPRLRMGGAIHLNRHMPQGLYRNNFNFFICFTKCVTEMISKHFVHVTVMVSACISGTLYSTHKSLYFCTLSVSFFTKFLFVGLVKSISRYISLAFVLNLQLTATLTGPLKFHYKHLCLSPLSHVPWDG